MPQMFARLTKVDEQKRLVYGRLAQEIPDRAGEILDYESSKPHFAKWSEDIAKATNGQSMGNLRAMHGNIAAGKFTRVEFNDADKAIDVCAKVVDDAEWKKVLEGVYTGFSVGGRYIGDRKAETIDGVEIMRYTAAPVEGSLVDMPCIPSATFFEILKSDGVKSQVQFANRQELEMIGTEDDISKLADLMKSKGLTVSDLLAKADEMKDEKDKEEKKAESKDDKKPGERKYGDVKFADEKNKKYPIDTEEHIRAAWNYINKEKNAGKYSPEDLKTVKNKIIAAWKDKIDKEGPPSAQDSEKFAKFTNTQSRILRKGLRGCAEFACLIQSLYDFKQCQEFEAEFEGDESDIPEKLSACIAMCGQILQEMVAEEMSEIGGEEGKESTMDGKPVQAIAEMKPLDNPLATEQPEPMERAAKLGALAKSHPSPLLTLIKAGARHSSTDKGLLDGIHDAAVKMGATCSTGEMDSSEKMAKLLEAGIEPLRKSLDEAKAKIEKMQREPMPARIALRVVSKSEDIAEADAKKVEKVLDSFGKPHDAAGLIKSLHIGGGKPLGL